MILQELTVRGWCERLIPFLFAGMETCLIDIVLLEIVSLGWYQQSGPFVPLWLPFVVIAASYWFVQTLTTRTTTHVNSGHQSAKLYKALRLAGSALSVMLLAFVILLGNITVLDGSPFTATALRDLSQSFTLSSDALVRLALVLLFSLFLFRRGANIAQRRLEPDYATKMAWPAGLLLLFILTERFFRTLTTSITFDYMPLAAFTITFLALLLMLHTLANVAYVRRHHAAGLYGSSTEQDRTTLFSIIPICIVLVTAGLLLELFLQNLLNPVHVHLPPYVPKPIKYPNNRHHLPLPSSGGSPVIPIIVLSLLAIAAIALIVWFIGRQRVFAWEQRPRKTRETRESIWSWDLLLAQLRGMLWSLRAAIIACFARVRQAITLNIGRTRMAGMQELPVGTIREIYRALLKHAARQGYERRQSETPYEFKGQLNRNLPSLEAPMATITDAYVVARYSGIQPEEQEVTRIRTLWQEIASRPWIEPAGNQQEPIV